MFKKKPLPLRGPEVVRRGLTDEIEQNPQIVPKVAVLLALKEFYKEGYGSDLLKDPRVIELVAEAAMRAVEMHHNLSIGMSGAFPWDHVGIDPKVVKLALNEIEELNA